MASRTWRILALPPLDEGLLRGLVAPLGDAAELLLPATRDAAGLHAALADADLVIGDYTGLLAMDAAAVAAAPRLAFVQMPQVGVDGCDLAALTGAGVPVANTAGANTRAVAEWAVGAAFALCRHLAWADRRVRAGEWPQPELLMRGTREIHAQRVGILGHGAIGAETASLFAALGAPVSYWSRTPKPDAVAEYRPLDDLLSTSDVLVLALPLTPETAGLLDAARLALLPHGALLVNVARGGVVDEAALLAALDSGALGGAALDVFAEEPPPVASPLRAHDNVLLSPHVAGASGQAQLNIVQVVVDNITAAVRGEPVRNVVNGVDPLIRLR
ncbi:NAD(P)-dependent oxidoreductase [Thermomonospora umbrina]|uniref:D-3-phosphoglycerate dehydrogenase n=1 Tax=Thermomonospora umbrina TaxID=111806 RepID=A0A3D9SV64_9ACTN|nr:NAD(P)-dependent oxidoreductase [Thermomonospora umbrina]REE99842.1 D-3-phosphoglycerate dehydrogenase [Thermomonospora umbrina]